MFDRLSSSIQRALAGLGSRRTLTDAHLQPALRELRRALLEADVPLEVARPFLERVGERARGAERVSGVQAQQQIVAAVHEELVALLGPVDTRLPRRAGAPAVLLVLGLQGSGKTTSVAKLAHHAAQRGKRKPLLVAADLARPAAEAQLRVLAEAAEVPVFGASDARQSRLRGLLRGPLSPAEVCQQGVARAAELGCDLVLLDTAGRLHVDDQLMEELREVARLTQPDQCLLVCDALSGQDAVRSARAFSRAVELSGVILTKTDGDARGGAALSVKAIVGRPIKFLGTGEKLADLEPLRPEGLASRILGQGDVVELVRLAREHNAQPAESAAERLQRGELDFEDFLAQLRALRRMGLRRVLGLLPGLPGAAALPAQVTGEELGPIEAMICSMTAQERRHPELLSQRGGGRRRRRIAEGAGRRVREVNDLIKQFKQTQGLLRALAGAKQVPRAPRPAKPPAARRRRKARRRRRKR